MKRVELAISSGQVLMIEAIGQEIDAILDEIVEKYAGYEFEKTPIELINYHEKCPL